MYIFIVSKENETDNNVTAAYIALLLGCLVPAKCIDGIDVLLKEFVQFHKFISLGNESSIAASIAKVLKDLELCSSMLYINESTHNQHEKNSENPFRVPKDDEIFGLREKEKKKLSKKKLHEMSIIEKSTIKRNNYKAVLKSEEEESQSLVELAKKKGNDILLLKKQIREQKLLDDEKALEEDAAKFDAFLKENDKNSVEAMKRAELETKAKLEKMQEIKKINAQIVNIRSEMSKNEDQLKDYQKYREFLEKLSPSDWLQERKLKKLQEKSLKETNSLGDEISNSARRKRRPSKVNSEEEAEKVENDLNYDPDSDLEEEAPLYFQNPQQLLAIFSELEETNLSLIQNVQEMEETLEDLRQKTHETEKSMEKATKGLRDQIEFIEAAIKKEEEKAKILEERSKDTNIGTLSMLTAIENKLEQLFESIEMLPPDKVEQAEKIKDKERRHRIREEKLEAQRLIQEERVQRALERAKAPVKKKTGKPLVFRSAPPQKRKVQVNETKKKEEDLEFYFRE
ncbi:hypothetical protein ROZALSC1DRAFT_28063 [Rozella allomycis CSF55]|uniref:DUF4200 domain-containing protein n=1 Tax=Rozella allomycis (strain CSF55) TaxID=988480 RepID=A0A075AN18_ROZAC|nr:hypothetical protein O9G_001047 [Rozella allomycis CSF55]RKP20452.1 hypothetical protein ROZALSC1DRAFT_28063 [Rozella allomycis CSF55]|eukprot:EPZ31136.1 hypothetical protein O9G_001047 [Rozella allomycis CSF55]